MKRGVPIRGRDAVVKLIALCYISPRPATPPFRALYLCKSYDNAVLKLEGSRVGAEWELSWSLILSLSLSLSSTLQLWSHDSFMSIWLPLLRSRHRDLGGCYGRRSFAAFFHCKRKDSRLEINFGG